MTDKPEGNDIARIAKADEDTQGHIARIAREGNDIARIAREGEDQ